MNEFKFDLGDEVRDRVTRFKGIIIARTQWITQCNTYMVQKQLSRTEKDIRDPESFDENRLVITKSFKVKVQGYTAPGGPHPNVTPKNKV